MRGAELRTVSELELDERVDGGEPVGSVVCAASRQLVRMLALKSSWQSRGLGHRSPTPVKGARGCGAAASSPRMGRTPPHVNPLPLLVARGEGGLIMERANRVSAIGWSDYQGKRLQVSEPPSLDGPEGRRARHLRDAHGLGAARGNSGQQGGQRMSCGATRCPGASY